MGCSCGKPEEVVLKHLKPLCRECFISLLKKRVKRELRGFQKGQKVLLVLHNDAASHLLKKVFAAIAEKIPMTVEEGTEVKEGYDKVVVPFIADDIVVKFLDEIMNAKNSPADPDFLVRPLKNITREEIAEYGKLVGLPVKIVDSPTQRFIDELEQKYPSTKFAVLKSKEEVK